MHPLELNETTIEEQKLAEVSLWWRMKEFSKDALICVIFYGVCMLPIWLICKLIGILIPLPSIHANSDILLIVIIYFWWNSSRDSRILEERIIDLQKKIGLLQRKL